MKNHLTSEILVMYNEELSRAIEESGILADYIIPNESGEGGERSEGKNLKETPVKEIKKIIEAKGEDFQFFYTDTQECYAKVRSNGQIRAFKLGSDKFYNLIKKIYYEKYDKLPPKDFPKEFSGLLEFEILNECIPAERISISTRIAKYEDSIYYDLSNKKGEVVEITQNGYIVTENPPIIFNEFPHQLPQMIPQKEADVKDIYKIFKYIRIDERFRTLFLAYLISCYIPEIPHPVNVVYGAQGSAKITTNRLIKSLIDPSKLTNLSLPANTQKFVETVFPHWWVSFDNVSNIRPSISDELCKAVTGASTQNRKLYTNDDMCLYTYNNCIAINGIPCVVEKPDLMDRSLLFELATIEQSERKTMNDILEEWGIDKPYILGAIFKILSNSIKMYAKGTRPENLLRLADFEVWGYCIGQALGEKGEEFSKQLRANRQIQNIQVINSNTVAMAVIEYIERYLENNSKDSDCIKFEVSSTEFYEHVKKRAIDSDLIGLRGFPANVPNFVKALKRLSPVLEEIGIKIETKHTKIKNILHVKINKVTFTPFTPSPDDCSESCSGDCSGVHAGDCSDNCSNGCSDNHVATDCEFDGYENVMFDSDGDLPFT